MHRQKEYRTELERQRGREGLAEKDLLGPSLRCVPRP